MDLSKHIKPLAGELDWPIWKRKVRDLLDYHEGALDVIDNKLKKPDPLAANSTENQIKVHKEKTDIYRKANSYAKSMITSSVSDEVYQKIMDKESAHDAWEALKSNFEATSKYQLFKICSDFFNFSWSSEDDVSTHIARLRSLWNELNNGLVAKGEQRLPNLILMCKTLNILPTTFETFHSSWMLLTRDEDRSFDDLMAQLCMFERNFRKPEVKKGVSEALVTSHSSKQRRKCSTIKWESNKKEDLCNYCKKKGHWVRNCSKWIADGKPKKIVGETESNLLDFKVAFVCSSKAYSEDKNKYDWWIDNGATKHVTNCLEFFVTFQSFNDDCVVKAAGKESLKAVGKGNIEVLLTVNNRKEKLLLKDVWYVPDISRNLFSVLAAQDNNPRSKFTSYTTYCQLDVNGKTYLEGDRERHGTLYKAKMKTIIPNQICDVNVAVVDSSLLQLYHERWGHQDKRHIIQLLQRELGIRVKNETELCEPCIYGKAHRLPFGTRIKTTKPGDLVTADVCGPFDESFGKRRYLVLFKDSFTKFRYGYIIKHKSEVKEILKCMIRNSKAHGHIIMEFLSDNGGEFDNEDVRKILKQEGINQRFTAPYTPEQNGGIERENRTVVEMARTFKYSNEDVSFPSAIWAELVSTAVYILNRTGKSSIEGASPYELWISKKPRIKHFRVIGSTCYVHIPLQKRRKMDEKAIKGYLVGYNGDEGYRVYIKENHKVLVSRDVIFQENLTSCIKKKSNELMSEGVVLQESQEKNTEVRLPFKNIDERKEDSLPEEIVHSQDVEENEQVMEEVSSSQDVVQGNSYSDTSVEDFQECENLSSSEEDNVQDEDSSQIRRTLRDRSTLRKPDRFEGFIMAAENFVNVIDIPETYSEAVNNTHCMEWRQAMQSEINSLNENKTWKLSSLPKSVKAIECKRVFCVKKNPDESIDRYKARHIAKGFSQRYGIYYNQTFSPVAQLLLQVRSCILHNLKLFS